MSRSTMNGNDVEKRWLNNPESFRDAALYVAAVLVVTAAAVLLAGAIAAFVWAYRTWKRGQSWPVWQGAGGFCSR